MDPVVGTVEHIDLFIPLNAHLLDADKELTRATVVEGAVRDKIDQLLDERNALCSNAESEVSE